MINNLMNKHFGKDLERTATILGAIYSIILIISFFTPINFVIPFIYGIFATFLYLISGIILNSNSNLRLSMIWFINSTLIYNLIF